VGNSGTIKPGERRNPHGRPKKGNALTDLFRAYLNKKDPENLVARKKLFIEELYRRSVGGWVADPTDPNRREYVRGSDDLFKYAINRLDGLPIQSLELSGENGGPIEVALTPDERSARILQLLEKLQPNGDPTRPPE
jgi:hypothetical protein